MLLESGKLMRGNARVLQLIRINDLLLTKQTCNKINKKREQLYASGKQKNFKRKRTQARAVISKSKASRKDA